MYRESIREEIVQFFQHNAGTASSPFVEWDAFKVYIRGICMKSTASVRAVLRSQLEQAESELRRLELLSVTVAPPRSPLPHQQEKPPQLSTNLAQQH